MEDMIKKAFYLGLGALSFTKDKAEKFMNEMVEKGEMSAEEGNKFVDDLIKRGEEARQEIKDFVEQEIKCKHKDMVSREEYDALLQRLKDLEDRLK
jgi:polyhydroxyalkanoate synthesis regulator phasin